MTHPNPTRIRLLIGLALTALVLIGSGLYMAGRATAPDPRPGFPWPCQEDEQAVILPDPTGTQGLRGYCSGDGTAPAATPLPASQGR